MTSGEEPGLLFEATVNGSVTEVRLPATTF